MGILTGSTQVHINAADLATSEQKAQHLAQVDKLVENALNVRPTNVTRNSLGIVTGASAQVLMPGIDASKLSRGF